MTQKPTMADVRALLEQTNAQLLADRVLLKEAEAECDQWQRKVAELWGENTRLRAGIEQIRDASAFMVCDEFETCQHKGCQGSVGAHLIALALLGRDNANYEQPSSERIAPRPESNP